MTEGWADDLESLSSKIRDQAVALPPAKIPVSRLLPRLRAARQDLLESFAAASGFPMADVQRLWTDMMDFLGHAPALAPIRASRVIPASGQLRWSATLRREPWGRCLICLPANAPVPLAVVLPLLFAAAGNTVVIAASARTRAVALRLANLVQTQFPERITLWGGSVRAVIQALLQAGTLDLLYFLGSSGPFESISAAAARSGVTLFYEGQGNGVLIAGYDLTGSTDIHRVASLVVESKVFCNGEMCSSPNVLAVPEACLADYQTAIVEAVAALDRRPSIPHRAAAILDRVLAEGAGSLAVPPGEEGTGPMFVSVTSAEVAMDHELFAPAAFLLPYSDPQRLVTQIAQHRFNLQLTVMTREAALFESILAGTRHARYCWNMFPVDQDLRLPWGNYGKSGYSPLEEIATKVFRPVLVEAGTGLPGPGGHP